MWNIFGVILHCHSAGLLLGLEYGDNYIWGSNMWNIFGAILHCRSAGLLLGLEYGDNIFGDQIQSVDFNVVYVGRQPVASGAAC